MNPFVQKEKKAAALFRSAVVAEVYSDGVTLYLSGESTATQKHSQVLKPSAIAKGSKVLCAKVSDTSYVVLGVLGAP